MNKFKIDKTLKIKTTVIDNIPTSKQLPWSKENSVSVIR